MGATINNESTTTEPPPWTRDLNAIYLHQIFALDSAIVKTQKVFSSHGGFLIYAMHHHRERSNQTNTQ